MHLRYITCSDPREHNSINSIIKLSHLPHAEIAVQCHPSKMSVGMPRNVWFEQLLSEAKQTSNINLAIHINSEWAHAIATQGDIPDIILNWIKIEQSYHVPLIKRIQLNMSRNTADNINPDKLAQIIHDFSYTEFIFQYNEKTKAAVEKMHLTGVPFSLLFDASGGNGISPVAWQKPVYENHPMGYSGGLGVSNVIQNLNKISRVVPQSEHIWIDAEGKLKSPTLFEEKPLFDTDLATQYVRRANIWSKQR